ncbi:MAG: ASCH domain-containing protein [Actinomycetia bacterium]|nr:ASCH domain-containing protein [Actinomycetes bacterium]MCP4083631.1 ASCH domain-containing protein [Actinomycetes bacterium]
MADQRVHLEFDGALAIVTLDHPPLNIYDLAMRDALIAAVTAVRDVPMTRAMVLRAENKHFSAGADLSEFGTADSIIEARRIRWDRDPWGPLWELPVPTVVALHGIAVGSGMEMSMLADIRVAAPDTRMGLPETGLAMLPAAGGTQSLTRAVGPHAALPLVLTADTIDAPEAHRRGLVTEVVDDVEAAARETAGQLSQLDPDIARATRRLSHAAGDLPLNDGLALERRLARTVGGRVRSRRAGAAMWADYCAASGHQGPYTAWGFGNRSDPELMTDLAVLVGDGPKRATAGLVADYEAENEPLPRNGDHSIVLDGQGLPVCIISTTEVVVVPFGEVDEQFARDEGEGDRTLTWWRTSHQGYFAGQGLDDDTPMVLERFDKVWPA